jgi:hypothetical protein
LSRDIKSPTASISCHPAATPELHDGTPHQPPSDEAVGTTGPNTKRFDVFSNFLFFQKFLKTSSF